MMREEVQTRMPRYNKNETKLPRDFGTNVKVEREKHGWSQAQLAARASMARSYISDLENAENAATLVIVARLARALKVSPALLVDDPKINRRKDKNSS